MVGSADTSGSVDSSAERPSSPGSSDASDAARTQGAEPPALRVDFYVIEAASASARLKLACRLAEKAYLSAQSALIWHTDLEELKAFDDMLWTFMDGSFVPHDMLSTNSSVDETPVILSAGIAPPKRFDILINLAPELPTCLSQTHRVAEIIDGEESRRRAGRLRFKAYRDLGVQPATHNLRAD
jgi:DNA polymerase III subunit chi